MQQKLVLWVALFASTIAYGVVLRVVAPPAAPASPMLLYALGAAALGSAVASIVLSRMTFRAALSRLSPQIREEPDTSQVQFRDKVPMRRLFADGARARADAMRVHTTPFIIGMALAESVALYGFVLGFLGFPLVNVIPFFVACWALMIFHFPRTRAIEAAIETAHDAKF